MIWALILLPCGRHRSRDSDMTCDQDKIITWLQGLTLCSHYLFAGYWKMFHVWSWETSPGCTDVSDGSTKLKTDLPQERCTMWLPPLGQGPGQVSWSVGLSSLEIVRTMLSLGHHPSSSWSWSTCTSLRQWFLVELRASQGDNCDYNTSWTSAACPTRWRLSLDTLERLHLRACLGSPRCPTRSPPPGGKCSWGSGGLGTLYRVLPLWPGPGWVANDGWMNR